MNVQRLRQVGNSYGLLVPVKVRRELGWWPSDEIELHVQDGALVLINSTQHKVTPVLKDQRHEYNRDRTA